MLVGKNSGEKINVLIVEDSIPSLVLMAKVVTKLGYLARPVASIAQARRAIAYYLPQLILMDISLPVSSGFDLCMELKSSAEYRQIPIIFVTGYDSVSYKLRAYQLGAVDYIVKPFQVEELSYKVKLYVENTLKNQRLLGTMHQLQLILQERNEAIKQEQQKMFELLYYMIHGTEQEKEQLQLIGNYARQLACDLQLLPKYAREIDVTFVEQIRVVAPIYDFGMHVVEKAIVTKEETLSEQELELVKRHTTDGVKELLKMKKKYPENPYWNMALEVAMYHHERYDGRGYPYGLVKEEIPLAARIVAIVSVYVTLCSEQCDRGAYEPREALQIMEEEKSTYFDPDILKVFLKINRKLHSDEEEKYEVQESN